MKSFFLVILFFLLWAAAFSQTWTKKADFSGGIRRAAVGFSIGSKGYIGTGIDYDSLRSDFWEWDQATDTWTQKANFGGVPRRNAASFIVNSKGYVIAGRDEIGLLKDFWEWDPAQNTWTQKNDFSGQAREFTVCFSIGSKGYLGTGSIKKSDFWEWDSATDTWTQKTDFGGNGRQGAAGFAIGSKGYILFGGEARDGPYLNDFWEWDQQTDSWTQKANIPILGNGRMYGVAFSIGNVGYFGTGYFRYAFGDSNISHTNDLWSWDQPTNSWTQKANMPVGRSMGVGFAIGSMGYIGTGATKIDSGGFIYPYITINDFWEYCDTCAVGINEKNSIADISIFPNPSNGIFRLNSNTEIEAITIHSIKGELVFSEINQTNYSTIDISGLADGIYLIQVKMKEGIAIKKIIIQKYFFKT